jgi:rare lipoprotein A
MSRRWLGAGIAFALSACATAPKPSASESVALPGSGDIARADLPSQRGKSPYAPAQEDLSKRGHYTRGGLYKPGEADTVPSYVPDVEAIPEPAVVAEPRSRYGNRSPYTVLGQAYTVRDSANGYVEQGLASYYGNKFHGRRTSNLEVYDMYAFTAAHKSLPLPSFARVTNLDNGKSVVVRVNDRGPFHAGRVIDLSYAAAVKLGYREKGTARVEVRGLSAGEGPINEAARERYDAVAKTPAPSPSPSRSSAAAASPALQLPPGVRIASGKPVALAAKPANARPDTAMDKLVGMLPVAEASASERPAQAVAQPSAPAASQVAPAQAASASPTPGREWRFDMQQDGKAMTADEFDAWMKSRRARVATGKAGTPDPRLAASASASSPSAPPSSPAAAAASLATGGSGGTVTLQVASFANQTNAGHALGMLQRADIAARVMDANVNGKQVWRVRVGPIDAARAPELAARVVGLGFDPPHRVRD